MLWWLGCAWAISVGAVEDPRSRNDWVSDMAEILDDPTEARIEDRLDAIEADLGVEIAVVTVHEVDTPTPKDFATELFNTWGIGKAEANNGLLVLVVLGERRMEMETGYGLEIILSDGWLGAMQRREMVPLFKEGAYGPGVETGLIAIDTQLRRHEDDAREGTRGMTAAQRAKTRVKNDLGIHPATAAGIGGGTVLVFGGLGVGAVVRRRRRTCPNCEILMTMVAEELDDEHLDAGEQREESVGSIDHQIWQCKECGFHRHLKVGRWFSGYHACPSCSYKTASTSSTTVTYATRTSTGLRRHRETCSHCSHSRSWTTVIPMLPEPSSDSSSSFGSSGGGGGSWGGGSSGGGGAGSSW